MNEAANDDELDMLDRAGVAAPDARLACQVRGLAELVVDIPRRDAPPRAAIRPISISERAARHFAGQLERHRGAIAVRLAVEPAGCSGLRYRADPAAAIADDDAVIESGGVRVVVAPDSLPYLHGTRLDLVQDGLAQRLRFDNPDARQRCGCGESFSA